MAEFGVAGSAVGILSLGIQVCKELTQYYGSWKDSSKAVARMCNSVEHLGESLNVLELAIKEKGVATQAEAEVQNSIDASTAGIDELHEELVIVRQIEGSSIWSKVHGQGRRLLYPFRESTLMRLMEIIADIRGNLSLTVELLHL